MIRKKLWTVALLTKGETSFSLLSERLEEHLHQPLQVKCAANVAACMSAVGQNPVDFVLIDADPLSDGMTMLMELVSAGCQIPVILVTGQAVDEQSHLAAVEAGAANLLDWASLNPAVIDASLRAARTHRLIQDNLSLKQERHTLLENLDGMGDGFFALDPDWNFIFINEIAARRENRSPVDLVGKNIWEEIPSLVDQPVQQYFQQVMSTRSPLMFEVKSQGQEEWYEISAFPTPSGISVIWRNRTEKKLAELERDRLISELSAARAAAEKTAADTRATNKEFRSQNTRLYAILNSMNSAVIGYNKEGVVELANSFAVALLGFDPIRMHHSMLMRRINILVPDGDTVSQKDIAYRNAAKGETVLNIPITLYNSRGRTYSIQASAIPLYIGLDFSGVVVIWNDITNRERLQAEIRQKSALIENERVRMETVQQDHRMQMEMQHQLIQQREQERIQIARDLHDGPLQDLIALSFGMTEAMELDEKDERLAKMIWVRENLQREIRELRAYCNDLRPPVLAPFGLEKAIRSHIETMRERQPEIDFHLHLTPDGRRIPEDLRMTIFRIYRELVTNITRHSRASQVQIDFNIDNNMLILQVRDNGVGFEVPTNWVEIARKGHLGLVGARERVEAVGGVFEVQSSPGAGTYFSVQIPLNTHRQD